MSKNRLVVLGLLNEEPMHGYQMDQIVKHRHMEAWARINMASIYNTLSKLEESGHIKAERERVGNMPERSVYKATQKGIMLLEKLIIDGITKIVSHNNVEFLLAVGFINNISQDKAVKALKERKEEFERIIVYIDEVHSSHKENGVPFNWLHIIKTTSDRFKVDLMGAEELIKEINKGAKK